ncbi:hypothetical protein [Roseivirga pacifica]|uniref:hypothetical protein n=1 Tax=Roseivirga pacifica TaxID=1267423 RepID=UPI0020962AB7|nr:hypothetical protein [Roseivirga pacifica]MCO6358544.1 hypothetical protein [Roseivirga pacifica]MCO6369099.1 hypothetical protein [Roseivirga pacifica]MCO6372197.1 hypothetical protein [Roseivirga pacifica]MCO6374275.1 hypothetical protein [Roseivirga pacifica]MCO6380928.1 hypothetical protein [Roseivirga pacifica]
MVLTHIKAGGKERPFLFSYKAIRDLAKVDLSISDEMEVMSYLGFKYGAIKEGIEVDFNQEDVADWFEGDLPSFFEVVEVIKAMQPMLEKMQAPQNRQQRRSQKKTKA